MTDNITLSDTTHTARKPHQCSHCLQKIVPGETYRRFRGVWEGTPGVFKSHTECESAAEQMRENADLNWDEGVLLCSDISPEDHEWLLAEFPVVAARLGIIASSITKEPT